MSLWFPDSDDIITAHEYAGFISRVRTPGFHRSSDSGLKTLEDIVEKAKSQNDLYSSAAVYLRDIIKNILFRMVTIGRLI